MNRSGIAFVGVGAVVLALGGGLWAGKASRDCAAQDAARAEEQARRSAAAAAIMRRNGTLQRFTFLRSTQGAIPGIGVCASEELTNCEVRYGEPRQTMVWRVPRIVVPERCENLALNSGIACASVAADGSVQQFGQCFMLHGWLPAERGLFEVLDLRETPTPPNHASIQCDQGRYSAEFDPS